MRNEKGQFIKGITPHNKGKKSPWAKNLPQLFKKAIGIAIMSRFGGVKVVSTKTTFKEAVVENKADLRGADLHNANLRDAELCSAKFYGKGGTKKLTKKQLPDFLNALGFQVED